MKLKNLKIGLVDDEKSSLDILKVMIEEIPNCEVVFYTSKPDQVLELCDLTQPDLLIIDVHMPGYNGIVLTNLINSRDIPVILTSGYPLDAREVFEVEALDFLSKPISIMKLSKAITKAQNRLLISKGNDPLPQSETEHVFVKANKGYSFVKINISDIFYIKGSGHYSDIITKTYKYTSNLGMEELANVLANTPIKRIHKSYLVNFDKIKSISKKEVELEEKQICIPLGVSFSKNIQHYTQNKTL